MSLPQPHRVLVPALVFTFLACGGDGGGGPQPTLTIAKANPSGDNQTDTVLSTLPAAYRVLVTRDGAPAQGVTVSWSVPTGQGSVSAASTPTGADGIASVTRTLGSTAGSQTAQAAATGATGSPLTFTATATAGNAAALTKGSGDAQVGLASAQLPADYQVVARDAHGNAKSGVGVSWAVTTGNGSVTPMQNATGGGGVAAARHTLGPAQGTNSVRATGTGVPGSPQLTFTSTAVAMVTNVIDFAFSPQNTPIAPGDIVGWRWTGSAIHNVVFQDAGFTNSPNQSTGTHTQAFPNAGSYRYRCTFHSTDFTTGMVGTVTVQ